MGAEYKVHTKLLTGFETLGEMGENNSGIIKSMTCFISWRLRHADRVGTDTLWALLT